MRHSRLPANRMKLPVGAADRGQRGEAAGVINLSNVSECDHGGPVFLMIAVSARSVAVIVLELFERHRA
jgi:hypothetical protein